jgi:parvulin-like peptidyl-prolyl isomerase
LPTFSPSSPQLRTAINEITPDLILTAVDELLLIQRGRELGYVMGDEQFNNILSGIKKQNNLEDEQKFQAALKQEGLTLADLRRNLERSMLVTQVQRAEVNDKVSVNEEEARAYYAARTPRIHHAGRVHVARAPDRGAGERSRRERGPGRRGQGQGRGHPQAAASGEPFARLAADFLASSSKTNGGLIGPIKHDELDPRLQKILDAMQVGDVTEPLRTQRGYQLLKVETRTETRVKTFEQARADISNKVAEQKRQVELLKYLDQLREQATITWRNDDLKRAYEQGLEKRRQQQAPRRRPRARRRQRSSSAATMDDSSQPSVPAADGVGWFAVWTKSRHEQVVRTQLEQKAIEPSCPRSRDGAVGRTARRRSTGRSSRLLFRAVRSTAAAERVEVRRGGEHRLGRR